MILVVAEKPSVARDLARVLRCARKEGYFESATHRVAWALGHLVALKDPDEIDENTRSGGGRTCPSCRKKWIPRCCPKRAPSFPC